MDYEVYVQAPDGTPLMPTKRFRKVRHLLKSGKASVVYHTPFTIRLKEEPSGRYVQDVTLGIDPGRTNIGLAAVKEDGECLFLGKLTTCNKDVHTHMEERKHHRQASRRGERLVRKRRAKKNGTTTERFNAVGRMLPGYEKPLALKDIINTEARFNNRKRPKGWLTPSARHLLQTHLSVITLIGKILPIRKVSMEINKFAFMELEAGHKLFGDAFQNGPLKGYVDLHDAINSIQDGKCLLCGAAGIEHYHHMLPRHVNGSDTIHNIVGLCNTCHSKVHLNPIEKKNLSKLHGKRNKKYSGTSLLNIVMPFLLDELRSRFVDNFYPVTGLQTAENRKAAGLPKDHNIDAYVIACIGIGAEVGNPAVKPVMMCQYRHHDRQRIHKQSERTYYFGKDAVAKNRRPRSEKSKDSLKDWFEDQVTAFGFETANIMRSQLRVKKSTRSRNQMKRTLPGTLIRYNGKVYITRGRMNSGEYCLFRETGKAYYLKKECKTLPHSGGILFERSS